MNTLQAGFSRVDVTPMLGIGMAGYFVPRFADGVLDPLQINALALACGEEKVVLMSIDHCGIVKEVLNPMIDGVCAFHPYPYGTFSKLSSHRSKGDRVRSAGYPEICRCCQVGAGGYEAR